MSVGRTLYGKAVAAHPDINLKFWGDGWPGYQTDRPFSQNLERLDFRPDILWVYKPERLIGVRECKLPKIVAYNEAWPHVPGKALKEARDAGVDLVIHHHANDAECFPGIRAVHIPHAAPDAMFRATPLCERPVACLASGVHSPEFYPVRAVLSRLVAHKEIPGEIRPHPGYRLPSREACLAQYADYAAHLQRSKIALCCTSRWRYLLQKIPEALAAGCVVVTDPADDLVYRDLIQPHVIEVQPDWPKERMRDVVLDALKDPERLQEMATAGQKVAAEHFTTKRYAERFVSECRAAL